MAENKKSFIFYCDWKNTFDQLPSEKAGDLIKFMLAYVNDEDPTTDDILINAVFAGIKNTLKRDLRKYESYVEKQKENGKKGGRPPKPKKPKPFLENPTKPKKADSVSVSDSVNDSENDILLEKETKLKESFENFWNLYDKKVGREKAEKLWAKISDSEKERIIEYVPKYTKAIIDKQYRKNPETFLNQKTWNDEIIERNSITTQTTKGKDRIGVDFSEPL